MAPVIPFRRRSFFPSLLIALGAVALAIIGFAVVTAFLNFQSSRSGGVEQTKVEILRPTPNQSAQIDVIDGNTVRASMARCTAWLDSIHQSRRPCALRR